MKVLLNDGLASKGIELLKAHGFEVDTNKIPQEELASKIAGYDVIVVRSATKVKADIIDAGVGSLKAILRGGVGTDNIDVKYAKEKGIFVSNTPTASSDSVAEMALAHMFALSRFIAHANVTMRNGEWNKKEYKGVELAGKTLGIIGIGRIGQALAKKAMALGMKIIAWDAFVTKCDLPGVTMVSKEELLKNSDYISLHIPADPNGAVIGTAELAMMKEKAYLINCARGGVVDEAALIAALDAGKLAGAGFDVFVGEPKPNIDLVKHPKVSVTPHVGGETVEAQTRIGIEVAEILIKHFNK